MLAKLGSHLISLMVVCSLSTTALAQHAAVAPGFGVEGGIGYFALEGDDFLALSRPDLRLSARNADGKQRPARDTRSRWEL